jgi:type IV pilus assembly protein PilQ
VLADEEQQRRKLSDEQALAGEIRVLTKTLSYAKAEEVKPLLLKSSLSPRGNVEVDGRTNTLIITDLGERLTTASDLLNTLDKPQPQVEIEARIVQVKKNFQRTLGVQWGFNATANSALGNNTVLAFPNSASLTGAQGGSINGIPAAVNLPAPGATSGVGLQLGSVNGSFNLDVALTALETTGNGRVLSTPRVSTQNNVEAEIKQGTQIPIQTVANNTVTVSFKDAALVLKVTPQITAANTVIMKISLENGQADFTKAVNGIPPINTQSANTSVLVNDGQTTVIGGIFVSQEQTVNDRTPGLSQVPLIKWLFKRDDLRDQSTELLIFITPRISRI